MTGHSGFLVEIPLAVPIVLGGSGSRRSPRSAWRPSPPPSAPGAGSYIFRGVVALRHPADPARLGPGGLPGPGLRRRARRGRARARPAAAALRDSHRCCARGWRSALSRLRRLGLVERPPAEGRGSPTIVIGSKDGSEMIVLGHMLADLVEAETDAPGRPPVQPGRDTRLLQRAAQGGLDAYVEYTGTAVDHDPQGAPVQTDPADRPRARRGPS